MADLEVGKNQGQLDAWFVMSAMGLSQMDGGAAVRPTYDIDSPIFDRVTIHLDKKYYPGGQFAIEARNNSKENVCIQSVTLDGQPLNKPCSHHSQLADGGKLVFRLGPKPNKRWGVPGPELGKGVGHARH